LLLVQFVVMLAAVRLDLVEAVLQEVGVALVEVVFHRFHQEVEEVEEVVQDYQVVAYMLK
jgi:hypothetical protein